MEPASLAALARSRSQNYWLLARLFATPPDEALVIELRGAMRAGAPAGREPLSGDLAALRLALGGGDPAGLAARLAVEYTRLFRGLKEGHGPAPPYESVHRESRLMGETTLAVMRAYNEAGFGTIDSALGPQDHIGAELRFMSMLCFDEGSAWDTGTSREAVVILGRERRFLDEHLLRWVPDYCRVLAKESREPAYAAIASLAGQEVSLDAETVRGVLARFGLP
ncbi:MAG: molecular chaperone TorD family protein [Proteobacteria bacterium]|nr:molecular chaperone TorD family protein [Pseudomonadota bacterium]